VRSPVGSSRISPSRPRAASDAFLRVPGDRQCGSNPRVLRGHRRRLPCAHGSARTH
jgi:hypothetical protein